MRPSKHDLTRGPLYPRRPLAHWASLGAVACLGLQAGLTRAQALPEQAPILLRASPALQEKLVAPASGGLPTFVEGDLLFGRPDLETVIEGHAVLRRGDMVIRADRLEYYQPDDLARARGQVRINRAGNVYEGPLLELKVNKFEGFFTAPRYRFLHNDAHGEARRIEFQGEKHALIEDATFTTCRRLPGPSWMPDWILRAATLQIDNESETGYAESATLSFKGVPILPIPALSFPLTDKRKSGVLPPLMGLDNVNGAEVTIPYYWNMAPNRDATFWPVIMSKRGLNVGAGFRYLEPSYSGQVRADVMPADRLRDATRWGVSYTHQGTPDTGLAAIGRVGLSVNLNRVSDDQYWRDFTRTTPVLAQRLLPNDLGLAWSRGDLSVNFRALKWQTLQDDDAPITPPYDRLPQLAMRYARSDWHGLDYSIDADHTRFRSDPLKTLQPNGQRQYAVMQLSRPWLGSAGFVTPKLQFHASRYQFETPLANGERSASRTVPTFSLDAGQIYEREASFFGRSVRQTLEPRALYVNTPFRDQSLLPNYDSGANDFNFTSIYMENAFVGQDRISDSNLLTLGVSSRLQDLASGAELARFGVAQRLRFKDQRVTLPNTAAISERLSDMLLGAAVNWDPRWSFDATVQFNPKTKQSVRATLGGRYSPGHYRIVSAAYRFQRDSSRQLDIGWQWPINDLWGDRGQELGAGRGQGEGRWYSVGRLNYSLAEKKLVDAVIGVEYDAGCWLGRLVLERLQTSTSSANQRVMFQLEFVGFSRLGANPLKTLKENIPRYQYLREPVETPSRFSNYD